MTDLIIKKENMSIAFKIIQDIVMKYWKNQEKEALDRYEFNINKVHFNFIGY